MVRKTVIISSIAIALIASAALGQGRGGKARGRNALGGGRVLERLEQRLNLTDVQKNGLNALEENRRKESDSLRQEIQQKRQAIRQLMRQANPNPTDIGNATLAMKETRERMRGINQRFTSGFKALLTPDQLQKLPKRLQ